MEHAQRFVNLLRLHRVQASVVYQCALFQSYLKRRGIKSEVVKGYVNIASQGCCRHFWVHTDDEDIDIATMLGTRIAPEMTKFIMTLSEEPSGSRFDLDEESARIVADNESCYELFTKNPKQFWAESPVKNLRLG